MADEKPFSIPALIAAMKEAGFATRSDVEEVVGKQLETRGREIVGEEISSRGLATKEDVRQIVGAEMAARGLATVKDVEKITLSMADAILEGQAPIYERLDGIDKRINGIDQRLDKLEIGQAHIRDDIKGLNADLSDTPSRAEHNALKARVTILEKTH